jgi:ketosteroid isomerase-like protein
MTAIPKGFHLKKASALLALALMLPALTHAQRPAATSPELDRAGDKAAIEQVMASFHAAVVAHDGPGIVSLSVPEGSTWSNVLSEKAYHAAQAKKPDAVKVRRSSFSEFAEFVSSTLSALNPQHTHVQILTDGTIAAVYFDYVFLIDGKAQNKGCETWQLVKAADGWKIAAITYSSNPA